MGRLILYISDSLKKKIIIINYFKNLKKKKKKKKKKFERFQPFMEFVFQVKP
jgi:hypothetical protein